MWMTLLWVGPKMQDSGMWEEELIKGGQGPGIMGAPQAKVNWTVLCDWK
jgi:hypothetical protein